MWTGIDPVHNDTRERDTHRYYWSAKMAKDFVLMTGKETFTYKEVEGYFKDKVFLNYLNELILEAIDIFEEVLIKEAKIKVAFFDEHLPFWARQIPWLRKAKRQSKFINMDSIYYQFADIVQHNSTLIFKENLGDETDFRTDSIYYKPILTKDKNPKYLSVDYFRSPDEPYLTWEYKFDNMTKTKDARIRRSPLSQDKGIHDRKQEYIYEQRDINNTHIKRAFHVTVRDYNMNILNEEYGPGSGPFEDSRQ